MRGKLIFAVLLFLIIPLINAQEQTIGYVQQNTCIQLTQLCSDCTFINVSSILYPSPNNSLIVVNKLMTKNGYSYNYTFCDTNKLGKYVYNTIGDPAGSYKVQPVSFEVTGNGKEPPSGIVIVVAVTFFLMICGYLLYTLLDMLYKFSSFQYDLIDMLKDVSAYILLLMYFLMTNIYLGDPVVKDWLILFIQIGTFTHLVIPLMGLAGTMIIKNFTAIGDAYK